ncbi:MAG: Crp/Fnr family transcriptional regulator [Pseudohongiella sp.]|nr:Crp/Fnr family transcriptional regulator [Pseudohongiella sp.]
MIGNGSSRPANRLLDALPDDEKQLLLTHTETINLGLGEILFERGKSAKYVYFPTSGLISLVVDVDEQPPMELAMIGNEGMLGATKILGVSDAPAHGVVQLKGTALRMLSTTFDELSRDGTLFQAIVKRYLYVLMTQLSRTAGCTHYHEVSSRLARWLLMAHDRSDTDKFFLTQQFLSKMLGVQRSAVSIAASALQQKELISYSRGDISILNRRGLEEASCSCYASIAEDQRRYFP